MYLFFESSGNAFLINIIIIHNILDDIRDVEKLKLGKEQHVTYGHPMPPSVDQEQELCSPQETCRSCPKCTYINIMDAHIQPLRGVNITGLPPRLAGTLIIPN